jgi:predicted Zn finger-like uncharacterized protein
MIRVKCPGCATALNVKDDAAGKTVACPRCKERIKVAAPEDEMDDAPPAPRPKAPAPKPAPAPAVKKKAPPPEDEDEEDEAPARKPARAAKRSRDEEEEFEDDIEDDMDEDEEEDDRRNKKGKKNKKKKGKKGAPANTGNIIIGVICAVIGLLILIAAWVAPIVLGQENPWNYRIFGSIGGVCLLAYGAIKCFQE